MTGYRFPLPVNTGRVDCRAFPLAELTGNSASGNARPSTGHPSTRAVNSGSGNRALRCEQTDKQTVSNVLHTPSDIVD